MNSLLLYICFILSLIINTVVSFDSTVIILPIQTRKNDITKNRFYKLNDKYIWKNSLKLSILCDRILRRFKPEYPLLVYTRKRINGFGDMLHSLVFTVFLSLVGNYSLYYEYPQYSILFNGCFSSRIIHISKHMQFDSDCQPYNKCFPARLPIWTVEKYLQRNNTVISGFLIEPEKILQNTIYNGLWNTLFLDIESSINEWNIRKDIIRLLINPSDYLRSQLIKEQSKLLKYKYTIGLQLRMGGNVSDTHEQYVGIPISRIDEVINQVRKIISDYHWNGNVQLYIASDSSKVINLIRNKTIHEFPVVESTIYAHGHTKINEKQYYEVMNKVISDFYYMSLCDYVLVTWPSSMGRMMCYIKEKNECGKVLNWSVKDKRLPIPV